MMWWTAFALVLAFVVFLFIRGRKSGGVASRLTIKPLQGSEDAHKAAHAATYTPTQTEETLSAPDRIVIGENPSLPLVTIAATTDVAKFDSATPLDVSNNKAVSRLSSVLAATFHLQVILNFEQVMLAFFKLDS